MKTSKILALLIALLLILLTACTPATPDDVELPELPPADEYQQDSSENISTEPGTYQGWLDIPTRSSLPLNADTPHGYLAQQHILFMNDYLPERIAFSYQELEAAKWIVEELLSIGYTWAEIAVQEFSVADLFGQPGPVRHFFPIGDHQLREYSQNVILTVAGQSEQTIIIGAHYDSLLYPGASDNASGTALLLESAQRMRYLDNYYTLVYVFFGAEEIGLLGAAYYLDQLSETEEDNIVLMVNADVLLDGDTLFYAAGYSLQRNNIGENARTAQIDQIANRLNTTYDIDFNAVPDQVFLPSDHLPFLDAGHTILLFFGGNIINGGFEFDVFHSYRDDAHYIMANMPGRLEHAMWAFSLLLEEVLLLQP